MPRQTRAQQLTPSVTLLNLLDYRDYVFAWFSEIAIKLCTGMNLEELSQANIQSLLAEVCKCSNDLIAKLRKSGKDPCTVSPIPLTGNDPKDKMNLCYANKVLSDVSAGSKPNVLPLPPALSLEFAEFTRSFMGAGSEKRKIFILGEDVLALSVIGAYLSQSYAINREYGYIYVEIVPYPPALKKLRKLNSIAKKLTRIIQVNEGGINVVLLGIATAVSVVVRDIIRDIIRSDGHAIANYLRIARTGNKIIAKGFDSVDLIHLVKVILRGGIAGALYRMLSRYPPKEYSSLRRFIDLVAIDLIKFMSYRKPQYIYEILRYLTSSELNSEGAKWYTKKSGEELSWNEITERFSRLANLVR